MKNISVGTEALDDPFVNQGTAFSREARIKRKLRGLLPPRVTTLEHQAKRALERIRQAEEPVRNSIEFIPNRKGFMSRLKIRDPFKR